MGLNLSSKDNIDDVFDEIEAYIDKVNLIAVPRAINKVANQAQTAGLRKINDIYQIGPRTMEQYVYTTLASASDLTATINAKGAGFPLYLFSPRPTNKGVTVSIKGTRILILHAFIARMPSGHIGVFARGAYGARATHFEATGEAFGRFAFGKSRLPINELYTLSPPDAFDNPDVIKAMDDQVALQMPIVLAQEIKFATR